jgi:Rieske Fe-S protein
LEEVKVYDRQAPYNVIDQCRIYVETNNSNIAIDTCSGSEWFLLDGQVLKGPASYPLKEYQTVFDGTNLTITN